MTIFKNSKNGFTLIEVLLALAIMAVVMTSILMALSNGITNIRSRFDRLMVFLYAKQTLVEASIGMYEDLQPNKPFEKKFENPSTTCTYESVQLHKDSSLQSLTHLTLVRTKAQASPIGKKSVEATVAALLFVPEPRKQKVQQGVSTAQKGTNT